MKLFSYVNVLFFVVTPLFSSACGGADAKCDAVVAKMASLDPSGPGGESEKKFRNAICEEMPQSARNCVAGSKTYEEEKKCLESVKLK